MKITKELRALVDRSTDTMYRKATLERDEMAKKAAAEANAELLDSDEFKALKEAMKAWDAKADDIVKSSGGLLRENQLNLVAIAERMQSPRFEPIRYAPSFDLRDKYQNMADAIIIELSFCDEWDEAKKILSKHGIELAIK